MIKISKISLVTASLVVWFTASACFGGENRVSAINAPIVEGKSAGGISIGLTHDEVVKAMGKKPDLTEQPPGSAEKMLIYQLTPMTAEQSTSLIITVSKGKVSRIELSDQVAPGKSHSYKGKSTKGFGFGDNLKRIASLYGKPSVMLGSHAYWYREQGIAFFCIGPEAGTTPNSVVILAPGSDLPGYLTSGK